MLFPFYDENPTQRRPVVTIVIIALNLISLLWVEQLGPYQQRMVRAQYGFIPARLQHLNAGRAIRIPLFAQAELAHGILPPAGQPPFIDLTLKSQVVLPTLFTSLFLHAGWLHLLGNMWFFWIFGNNIEDRLGHSLFLLFYVGGGAFATMVHYALTGPGMQSLVPLIGASGAVAVTLGAYAVTYPFTRVRTVIFIVLYFTIVELPAILVLGAWFLVQMTNAYFAPMGMGGGVAWWAHIGGFAVGAAIMPLLSRFLGPPRSVEPVSWPTLANREEP